MQVCAACSRHVLPDAAVCPFCGVAQRSTLLIPGVLLGLVLGLAAVACTERKPDDTTTTVASETTDATMTGAVTDASTSGDSTTGTSTDASATVPTVTGDSEDSSSSSSSTDTGSTTNDTNDTLPMPYGAPPPSSATLWV